MKRIDQPHGWALLRATRFTSRPAHADQLHVDLWRNGQPVTLDAGTYRYSAAPPWQNGLVSARVHNTITLDEQEPMTQAGKFLWLDWDQARWLAVEPGALQAEHDGWRRLGVLHRRQLETAPVGWQVIDELLPAVAAQLDHRFILHWLLPDADWFLEGLVLTLRGAETTRIEVSASLPGAQAELVRAGRPLVGHPVAVETLGWHSPTYNVRGPALSFRIVVTGQAPLVMKTRVQFIDVPAQDE